MSAASRGEDTERKNCQTNTQVTSFIPRLLSVSQARWFPVDYTIVF